MMNSTIKNKVLTALGFLGILVAGELSLAIAFNGQVPCGIAGGGCEKVAQDSYSHLILGIPNAYLGLGAYLILTAFAAARIYVGIFQEPRSIKLGLWISGVGLAYSLLLLYRMLFVIKALCPWCITSDIVLAITFVFYWMLNSDLVAFQKSGSTETPNHQLGTDKFYVPLLFVISFGLLGILALKMRPGSTSLPGMTNANFNVLETGNINVLNPTGKMTIIEFGDVVCPVCRRAYPKVDKIVSDSDGKIRFIYHNFPLIMRPDHINAFPGAMLAEMAGEKGKFFDFLSAVYFLPAGSQPSAEQMITLPQMETIAEGLGVSKKEIDTRLQAATNPADTDPAYLEVLHDLKLGQEFKVSGTPTYFLIVPHQPPVMADSTSIMQTLSEPQFTKYEGPPTGP